MRHSILIATHDTDFVSSVGNIFLHDRSTIITSSYGCDVMEMFKNNKIDMAFIDLLLQDMTGIELITSIRSKMINIPIIALYKSDLERSLWEKLQDEIDLFIEKGDSKNDLKIQLLRCQKKLSRWDIHPSTTLKKKVGSFEFNNDTGEIWLNRQALNLTVKQTRLLKYFIDNPNKPLAKNEIIVNVWDTKYLSNSTLSVYINGLRNKIEANPRDPKYLKTAWGIGYCLNI